MNYINFGKSVAAENRARGNPLPIFADLRKMNFNKQKYNYTVI